MERLLVAAALVAVAVVVALVVERRRPAAPTQPRWTAPSQLDRDDFAEAGVPWLVAVFTSATCDSCRDATAKALVLRSDQVAYQEVAWQDRKDLHDRYGIDVVPTTVMADADGVVRASFVGSTTATDLWAALADARRPPPE
ncbi:MAG: hypothetical protein ACRDZW_11615 [Acidimicrobiales bacterium]